jgi:UDP-N-acetylglucosamine--N-acetylmuramyl-(pentapeptide) pyrophosphoryl-undecaprenol N-acetylglucosamine transferase
VKLLVSAGGTGGHVYPALAVVDALLEPRSSGSKLPTVRPADLLWIGSKGGYEGELVDRTGIRLVELAAGGLRGIRLDKRMRNTVQIARSIGQARRVIRQFKPDVVFVTGGYACVSVTLAARTQQVPVLIYLPDIVPGLAIRSLSRFAAKVAVTSEESYQHLNPDKAVVTGYPVRSALYELDRVQAQESLGLEPGERTLLVFGGSRGARSINQALVAGLRELLPVCQIIHISGRLDAEWVAGAARSLPEVHQGRYHHYAYLHDMPQALVAADLAVARSGAATMGEFPAVGLPAVLVPYPYSGQHQEANAKYMARNGAARVLPDDQLGQKLVPTIRRLLDDDKALASMRESALAMARPDAAEAIAVHLWQVARGSAGSSAGADQ